MTRGVTHAMRWGMAHEERSVCSLLLALFVVEGTHFSLNGEEFSGGLGYGSELVW